MSSFEERKTLQTTNCTFHYIKKGSGDTVIFIHGSISDYRTWRHQIEPFAEHFHTIAYSRRHHYPSGPEDDISDYSVPRHAEDLIDFIEALDTGSVNIVGSSYGAYTSLLAAIKKPDLIKALVFGEPPVVPLLVANMNNPLHVLFLLARDFSTGKSFLNFGIKAVNPAKKQLKKGNMEEGVRIFANGVLGENGFENLPAEVKTSMTDNAAALKAELLGPGFPDFSKKEVSELNVPVLLVYGEKSPIFFHSISDKLLKILPDSEKFVIPDVTHNMHSANPEAYNQKIIHFLKNNQGAGA